MRSFPPVSIIFVFMSLLLAGFVQDAAGLGGTEETVPATPDAPVDSEFAGRIPAPEFPQGLEWVNSSRPLTWEELRGKVVVVDFWTYGCINCIHNLPFLADLQEEFEEELVIVGVHSAKFTTEGNLENIRRVSQRYSVDHPVVNDQDFEIWRAWGVSVWPTLFIVDPLGQVSTYHLGEGFYDGFRRVISTMIDDFDEHIDRTPVDFAVDEAGLPRTVLSFPGKVVVDEDAGRLFIADTSHNRILEVSIDGFEVRRIFGSGETGVVDGVGQEARFTLPHGMALDPENDRLFVADTGNHAIRIIDLETGEVRLWAGTGRQSEHYPPLPAPIGYVKLSSPWDLVLDDDTLYVAMAGSHQLWRFTLDDDEAWPIAGSGAEGTDDAPGLEATLAQPSGLTIGADGYLYFAESEASSIRRVDIGDPDYPVSTVAGSGESLFEFGLADGVGSEALFQHPLGIDVAPDGSLLVADTYNSAIRRIDPESRRVETVSGGSGQGWRDGTDPLYFEPGGLDVVGSKVYIADTNNHALRVLDLESGAVSTAVLTGIDRFFAPTRPDRPAEELVLEEVRLSPGESRLVIDVDLPEGYKINPTATSLAAATAEGEAVRLPGASETREPGLSFPVSFPLTVGRGAGEIRVDLSLVYCEAVNEELCYFEDVTLRVPVQSGRLFAEEELGIRHEIELSTGPGVFQAPLPRAE
ncbi:MAG: thioredoxin-like domain-containing protein [Spirochaetaceae bacterium]